LAVEFMAAQQGKRKADRIFEEAYLEGLRSWPQELLTEKRSECMALEEEISYNRRLLQGRLDILTHALQAKAAGSETSSAELVQNLPSILANQGPQTSLGRHLSLDIPTGPSEARRGEDTLAGFQNLEGLSTEELSSVTQDLKANQNKLSDERKRLHHIIDQLDQELVKRHQNAQSTLS